MRAEQGTPMAGSFGEAIGRLVAKHPLIVVGIPLAIGLGVQALLKQGSEWVEVFVPAGHVLGAGGDVYSSKGYLYPPFMALAALPFAWLPELVSRLAYYLVNVLCVVAMTRSAWSLSGGGALPPLGARALSTKPSSAKAFGANTLSADTFSANTWSEWAIFGVGILCSASYILNDLAHQQVDVMIDAGVVAGSFLLLRGNRIGGSVLIGLAAACKGPPLLFAPYLAFRRNWVAAAIIVVVAIGANFLPDLLIASPTGHVRFLEWLQHLFVPTFTGQPGSWNGVSTFNQSLAGTVQRLWTSTLQWTPTELVEVNNVRQVPASWIKTALYGLFLVMLATSVLTALRGQSAARAGASARLPSHTALEFAAVSLLMVLISPMSDLAHLGVVILPAFCLARIAAVYRDRTATAALVVAAAGAIVVNKDLVGGTFYTAALWGGAATWSLLALWVGCVIALARGRTGAPTGEFTRAILPLPAPRGAASAV